MRFLSAFALALMISATLLTQIVQADQPEREITKDEAEQVVTFVANAADRSAAIAGLSARERAAFLRYVTVTTFVTGKNVRASTATGGGKVAAPFADPCDTVHNWIRGQNGFGVTMYQFDHEITWCWNGSFISNNPATRSWASNICGVCGYSYQGLLNEARYPNDGYGQNVFTYQSQGHFHLANPSGDFYPTLRTEVYNNGGTYLQQWPG